MRRRKVAVNRGGDGGQTVPDFQHGSLHVAARAAAALPRPVPAVGLQGVQAQVGDDGSSESSHFEGEEEAEEGERGFRGSQEKHVNESQPEAAQGGDPAQRHPVHRETAGSGQLSQPAGTRAEQSALQSRGSTEGE